MLYTLFHKTDEGVLKRYFIEEKNVSPLWTSRHNLTRRRNRRTFGRGGGLGRMVFRGDEDGIGRRKQNVKRNYTGN